MSDRRRLDFYVDDDRVRRVWQVPSDGLPWVVWEDGH
jgi:hypothetical protein